MDTKRTGALAAMAVLAVGVFAAAAQAEGPLNDSGFLKAGSPLEPGSLIEARPGVGVESIGESDEERRRRLGGQPTGSLSGAARPLTRTGALPATRSASRAADIQISPAFVTALRNELSRIGFK